MVKGVFMRENLIGKRFGHLRVVASVPDEVSPKGAHQARWECVCDCGAKVITRGSSLKSGHTKGCGQKHRKIEDLTGRTFGKLTVIERGEDYINKDGTKYIRWYCRCECGRMSLVRGVALKYGSTKSCGICTRSASNMGKHQHDLTGKKFGRWTVLYENGRLTEPRGRVVPLWRCRCECGEERDIRAGTLVSGNSLSCGCYKHDMLAEKVKQGFGTSFSERTVNDFLKQYAEYYECQYTFPDLRSDSGYPLSYDFLVYKDGKPALLIECQGRQHYEPVEFFGGDERFVIQQKNDNKKRMYAAKHNIPLLEIPYTCNTQESIYQMLSLHKKGLFSYECS